MKRALLILWLTVVWTLLWGELTVGNVLIGGLLAVTLLVVFPTGGDRGSGVHPIAALRFGGWFAGALVAANVAVAREVLRPRLALEEGIVAVPLRSTSPLVAAFVANSITLTPGTLTVDIRPSEYGVAELDDDRAVAEGVEPPVLYVHCLVTGDPEAVRADCRALEERVVRAFGSADDRRALLKPGGTR